MKVKFGVVVFPGSNCDHDTLHVLRDVMGQQAVYLWHRDTGLQGVDAVILPGGFSFGDYLRCGAIAKFSPILESIRGFAAQGGTVLGICNGFQILQEVGLLPGVMLPNRGLKFVCEHVCLRCERNDTVFSRACRQGQLLRIPIAHNDGNFFVTARELEQLEENRQILFRYCDSQGRVTDEANPNGALANIAGVINRQGNVAALMPHPERVAEDLLGGTDGRLLFQSLIESLLAGTETGDRIPEAGRSGPFNRGGREAMDIRGVPA